MSASLPSGHRVVVSEFGETPLDALEKYTALVPMSAPDPAALGPREVIVAVKSAQVGWVDLLMTSGQYQHMAKPPYTPGLECAGEIVALGSEAHGVTVGEGVLVDGFLAGPRSLGKYQSQGGFASYVVVPVEAVHRLPGALDFDQACCLLGNYETAYHCLLARGRLAKGETVLVLGASGSTGLAAVQIAKLTGATVIATGRNEEKNAIVREQGADHVIAVKDAGFKDAVKEITGGKGVDVVYDGVGGETSLEALKCVKFGARFLIVGWAATPFVAQGKGQRGAPNANVLPTNLIMMKGLDVLGCPTAIGTANDPSLRPPRLAAILDWARHGSIKPHVSHRFALADWHEAMTAKWSGAVVGGCVLHP
jgi:NADPH2:quinone reductase